MDVRNKEICERNKQIYGEMEDVSVTVKLIITRKKKETFVQFKVKCRKGKNKWRGEVKRERA